jgi:hypothetical protein
LTHDEFLLQRSRHHREETANLDNSLDNHPELQHAHKGEMSEGNVPQAFFAPGCFKWLIVW